MLLISFQPKICGLDSYSLSSHLHLCRVEVRSFLPRAVVNPHLPLHVCNDYTRCISQRLHVAAQCLSANPPSLIMQANIPNCEHEWLICWQVSCSAIPAMRHIASCRQVGQTMQNINVSNHFS